MNVTILDDYGDALRRLPSFARLAGHRVRVWNDHAPDEGELAARLADTDALVLIRERTRISAGLLARCPLSRRFTISPASKSVTSASHIATHDVVVSCVDTKPGALAKLS